MRHLGSLSGFSARVNSGFVRLVLGFLFLGVISFLFEDVAGSLVLIHFGTLMVTLSSSNKVRILEKFKASNSSLL